MQRLGDDRLVAYLDGELETAQRREVEGWLDADPAARQPVAARAVVSGRWWVTLRAAASLFGLLVGGAAAYIGIGKVVPGNVAVKQPAVEAAAANNAWLDNAAGYFKLFVNAGDTPPIDAPAAG